MRRLERAVEHRQVLVLAGAARLRWSRARRCTRRSSSICVRGVAELAERHRHRLLTIFIIPPPTSFLYLTSAMSGLDAGRVAIHHEADGAGRRQHGGLRVAVAELLAELDRIVPRLPGARCSRSAGTLLGVDVLHRVAMLAHDAQERLAVDLVAGERTAVVARDPRRLRVGLAGHQRGDRRRRSRGRRRCRTAGRATSAARRGSRSRDRADGRRGCSSRSPWSDSSSCRPGSPAR